MAGALQIIKLLLMPCISILQLSLIWLIKILMQITFLLKSLSIIRISFRILWNVFQNYY